MANDKLAAVVQHISRVQLMTEGGWQYSSPLVRESGGNEVPLLDTPDAISIVALVVGDIDLLSRELFALVDEARTLGIDSIGMCRVDLPGLARIYQQLAMDLATASQKAIEQLKQPMRAERKRRASTTTTATQTSFLPDDDRPAQTENE